MTTSIILTFAFRGKLRRAQVTQLKSDEVLLEVNWNEEDLIWPYGKTFYVSATGLSLIGNQKPPADAGRLHKIILDLLANMRGSKLKSLLIAFPGVYGLVDLPA